MNRPLPFIPGPRVVWVGKTRVSIYYSPFHGFWQSFISIEVCRDFIPALASSCKKTINGFLCLRIVSLKSKTYQLNLKDVIKLNRNLWQLTEIKLLLAIRPKWYWLKRAFTLLRGRYSIDNTKL